MPKAQAVPGGVPSARRHLFILALLLGALLLMLVLAAGIGSVKIDFEEVLRTLFFPRQLDPTATNYRILWRMRFPRVVAASCGGAALAVAGLLLQVLFHNPIADPYVLGISSGARLFVGLVILGGASFGFGRSSPWLLFTAAAIGSTLSLVLMLSFAARVKSITVLLLIGIMLGYLCNALVGIMIVFSDDTEVANFTKWAMGSFSSLGWDQATVLFLVALIFTGLAFLLSKPLNLMLLGESYAQTMGVNISALRLGVVLLSGVLTAVVTAFAGLVGFIGMSVPHLARLLTRTADNRVLLPTTALLGALMCTGCDLIARTVIAPSELALGTVTSFIGVPIVMSLLLKRRPLV